MKGTLNLLTYLGRRAHMGQVLNEMAILIHKLHNCCQRQADYTAKTN